MVLTAQEIPSRGHDGPLSYVNAFRVGRDMKAATARAAGNTACAAGGSLPAILSIPAGALPKASRLELDPPMQDARQRRFDGATPTEHLRRVRGVCARDGPCSGAVRHSECARNAGAGP